MSKFSKHVGIGEPIKIGDDEFVLRPLTVEYIPAFFKAMKAFSGAKEGAEMSEILANIDDDGLNAIRDLIDKTLELSFPDEPVDERKQFGLKYMGLLLPKIFELNSAQPDDHESKKKIDALKRMRDKKATP